VCVCVREREREREKERVCVRDRQTLRSTSQSEIIPRHTNKFEFLDLVNLGDVAFSIESVMPELREIATGREGGGCLYLICIYRHIDI